MLGFINKYPLTGILGICLLLFLTAGMFFNAMLSGIEIHYLLVTVVLAIYGQSYTGRLSVIFTALFFFAAYMLSQQVCFWLLAGELLLFSIVYVQQKNTQNTFDLKTVFIIGTAFLLHLFYIQNTDVRIRQHDLDGILFYMREITKNGLNIADFNPWQMYYLFHQPLHFVLMGYLYLWEIYAWGSAQLAQNGLQYLSLFYVTSTAVVAAKIFRQLEFKGGIFYSLLILFVFNPTFFLFSGYISDDAPVLFWTVCFIYHLIRWHKVNKLKYIIWAALCFALGTLTKLSILLLVPAVCLLFIQELYTAFDKKRVFAGWCLFVIIAVPLSLFWIIRNHILYDMPFYNIPDTAPAGQNFYYMTFYERIFDFTYLLTPFINSPEQTDANMWLALIKTELFGEWDFSSKHPFIFVPAFALYVSNLLLKILSASGALFILWRSLRFGKVSIFSVFFAIIYFTIWFYSFKYALDYPYICSTDYRLFATLILPEVIILGKIIQKTPVEKIFSIGVLLYAFLTAFIYISVV